MTSRRCPLYLFACLAAAAALAPARAAPLDGEACARVKSEHEQLDTAGVDRDLAKGPAWAKANLAPQKLELVRRFIELEELLLFRCREKSLVTLPTRPEVAAVREERKEEREKRRPTAGKSAAPSKAPPSQKGAAPAARKPPAKAGPGRQSQWGVIVVERSPPAPAAEDAHKPPPFNPAAIAEQLGLPPG